MVYNKVKLLYIYNYWVINQYRIPIINWTADLDVFYFKGKRILIIRLKKMADILLIRAKAKILKLIFKKDERVLAELDPTLKEDNLSNNINEFGFLNIEVNKH